MLNTLKHCLLAGLALACATVAAARPIPVEGSEMVPNEFGSEFPREIIWEPDGMPMVLIPFGTFRRGLSSEAGGTAAESPEREIFLPSFYIDKFEVSNEQYLRFLTLSGMGMRPSPASNPELANPRHPVTAIPWNSANEYARWAGKQLPTEAMWEKAARGPENTLFTTGNQTPSQQQVIWGRGPQGSTVATTENTGDVSGYGVFHMNGNAAEFTQDWFLREYFRDAPRDNPQGPEIAETKSVRGASFLTRRESELRLTFRQGMPRSFVRDEIGFRTVWVPQLVEATPTPVPTPTPIPEPTIDERLSQLIRQLEPHFRQGTPRLPAELMAPRAMLGTDRSEVQFINNSPFRLTIAFVNAREGRVFIWGEPVPAMTYRNVTLPAEVDLHMIAFAAEAPSQGPKNIGFLRAESRARILIATEQFGPVRTRDDQLIAVLENSTSVQLYSDFTPQWNTIEIHNTIGEEIALVVEDTLLGPEQTRRVGEFTIGSRETLRLTLPPSAYRFRADYFGAAGDSSTPRELRLDDRAARRLLTIREDASREGGVTVIATRKPFLRLDLSESRALALTPSTR